MGDEHCNSHETTGSIDGRMILQLMRNQRTVSPGLEQYSRELAVAAIR
jgi:translation initiation factor 2 beta subunit (eIF-2beta)/eIF-5